jgi:hypothetical protein
MTPRQHMTPRRILVSAVSAGAFIASALGAGAAPASASASPAGALALSHQRLASSARPAAMSIAGKAVNTPVLSLGTADSDSDADLEGCEYEVVDPNINVRESPGGPVISPAPVFDSLFSAPSTVSAVVNGQEWVFGVLTAGGFSSYVAGWIGMDYLSKSFCGEASPLNSQSMAASARLAATSIAGKAVNTSLLSPVTPDSDSDADLQGCVYEVDDPNINVRESPAGTVIDPAPEYSLLFSAPRTVSGVVNGQEWVFGVLDNNDTDATGWIGKDYLDNIFCGEPSEGT